MRSSGLKEATFTFFDKKKMVLLSNIILVRRVVFVCILTFHFLIYTRSRPIISLRAYLLLHHFSSSVKKFIINFVAGKLYKTCRLDTETTP